MTRNQVTGLFTIEGSMGIGLGDRIYPSFSPQLLISSALIVIFSATLVSFIPARKIVNMDPVDALKGKLQ